jgi:hypothetical protein
METSDLLLAEKDYSNVGKTLVIALTLGGGLIPATISANMAMFKTLSGRKNADTEDLSDMKPGNTLDPTITETKYREYVYDSGAAGPDLPFSPLLLSADRIPLADVVAVLGRIKDVDTVADWKNLPSAKLPKVSETNPPMWLPRPAFKVNVRKAKFLGWPTDPKTGLPIGGQELKDAEMVRIAKKDAAIGDAALDAVFDTWAWGASVATPDKVETTLNICKPSALEVDLDAFVGAAVRGRGATGFAALSFVVIQVVAYGAIFIAPALRFFFDIDIGFGTLGAN